MKQNEKLTKVNGGKRLVISYNALGLCKHDLEKGLKEFVIIRKAYELIFEDSKFFYEQLAIAFNFESSKTNA
jgi:hypothetical protein